MIEQLLQLDENLLLTLNSIRSPFFDRALFIFSGKFVWALMYGAMLVALFRGFRSWKVAVVWTFATVLAIVLADQITATFIRPYFERLRPAHPENPISVFVNIVNGYRGGRYGFPSCHAANSFALAMVTALIWKGDRIKWFLFLWAALNSYSRVYLGVHYPGDLIVGAVLGCIFGAVAYLAGAAVVHRFFASELRRPDPHYARVGDFRFVYRNIDFAVLIGLFTIVQIFLIAMG